MKIRIQLLCVIMTALTCDCQRSNSFIKKDPDSSRFDKRIVNQHQPTQEFQEKVKNDRPFSNSNLNIGKFPLHPFPNFDNPNHKQQPENFVVTENVGLDVEKLVPADENIHDKDKIIESIPDVIDEFPEDVNFSELENHEEIIDGTSKHASGEILELSKDVEASTDPFIDEVFENHSETTASIFNSQTEASEDLQTSPTSYDEPHLLLSSDQTRRNINEFTTINLEPTLRRQLIRPQRQPEAAQYYNEQIEQNSFVNNINIKKSQRPARRPFSPQQKSVSINSIF